MNHLEAAEVMSAAREQQHKVPEGCFTRLFRCQNKQHLADLPSSNTIHQGTGDCSPANSQGMDRSRLRDEETYGCLQGTRSMNWKKSLEFFLDKSG